MKELFFVASQTARTLYTQLKQYRIDKVPGENIKTVSTIVMSISRRIWFSKKKAFPDFFIKTVLKLYQTSSVSTFNDHFKSLQSDYEKERMSASVDSYNTSASATTRFKDDLATIQWLTDGAKHYYEECCCDGIWFKTIKTKGGDQNASQALTTTVTCFNRGNSHHLSNCPVPLDESRISKNKAAYRKKKGEVKAKGVDNSNASAPKAKKKNDSIKTSKHSKSSSGKSLDLFRPPSHNETKRVITTKTHGEKVYTWNPSTARWDMDSPSAHTASGPSASTPVVQTDDASALRAQIAELQRQMVTLNPKI
jgi:hypothetical protein